MHHSPFPTDWLTRLETLCSRPAETPDDMQAKAALLARLITRDEADRPLGGPALILAASLADDVLVRTVP